jgi:hypothetical protein
MLRIPFGDSEKGDVGKSQSTNIQTGWIFLMTCLLSLIYFKSNNEYKHT